MHSADQLLATVWRRRISFVTTFVVVMAGVAIVTFSLPKVYTATSYLLISSLKSTGGAFESQQISQVDTQTVAELLQTRNAANTVASYMPYPIGAAALQSKVSVSPVTQTELVLITAHESSPLRAQQLANTYANAFSQQAAAAITSVKVSVAAPAARNPSPSSPRPKLYLLIGAILALLAATGVVALRQRLDQRLQIEDFATELLGVPILARVPDRRDSRRAFLPDARERATPTGVGFVEGFRMLFANLTFVGLGERPSTIAIVSASEQEGKSTVCAAIAQTAAEMMGSVLLVDGDLRRPSLSQQLGSGVGSPGLSSFLAGDRHETEDVSALVHKSAETGLCLVGAGPPPPNPSSLLGLPSLESFVQSAKSEYGLVIFDTPPVNVGADSSLIASHTDGAILVVDARTSRRASVEWALQQLRRAHVNVLGVILNRATDAIAAPYHYNGDGPDTSRSSSTATGRKAASRSA
jgi:polysaccharide biosynthesis transport protein